MDHSKIEKLRKVAMSYGSPEKGNASRILAKQGVYIDIAGIEWEKKHLVYFGEKKLLFMFGFNPLKI